VSSLNAVDNKTDLYLEFGVYTGVSINYFSKNMPDISFNGFDSFIGLEEDWKGHHRPKGHFDLNGEMPKVNKNVNLHKGFFNETLPDFLQNNRQDCAFIHIDSDTYEACEYVLNQLKPQIRKGTLILFDEYFGYIGWKFGEFKAWKKFVDEHHIQYEYLAFSHDQALLRII
jgi:predicted O-methyltransferase YrrM